MSLNKLSNLLYQGEKLEYKLKGSPEFCRCGERFIRKETRIDFDQKTRKPKSIRVEVYCPKSGSLKSDNSLHPGFLWFEAIES